MRAESSVSPCRTLATAGYRPTVRRRLPARRRLDRRLLIAALLLVQLTSHATPLAPACDATAKDRTVREQGFVDINGIPQWLTITGTDCRKPVLLFVHGGPGNPNTPIADALFGAWAQDFTLVQWDQRGAGRTYGKNLPVRELEPAEFNATPLTLALLAADGIQVAEYLQQRLGTPRSS